MKRLRPKIVYEYSGNGPRAGKVVSVSLQPEIYAQACVEAGALGISVSRYIRIAIHRGLYAGGFDDKDGVLEDILEPQMEETDLY